MKKNKPSNKTLKFDLEGIFGKGWEASNSHITFDALLTSITHLNKEMFEIPLTRKVLFEKFNKKSMWFYESKFLKNYDFEKIISNDINSMLDKL